MFQDKKERNRPRKERKEGRKKERKKRLKNKKKENDIKVMDIAEMISQAQDL